MRPPIRRSVLIVGAKRDDASPLATVLGYSWTTACHTGAELVTAVNRATREIDGLIDTLDVFDHGRAGVMALGDDILFNFETESHTTGIEALTAILPALAPRAQVRLLGCETAVGDAGRRLLMRLGVLLGPGRLAFGTIERVLPEQFGPDGFSLADELLFSSDAALDSLAPTIYARLDHLFERKDLVAAAG